MYGRLHTVWASTPQAKNNVIDLDRVIWGDTKPSNSFV